MGKQEEKEQEESSEDLFPDPPETVAEHSQEQPQWAMPARENESPKKGKKKKEKEKKTNKKKEISG